jgi:hypothetical protein
MIYINFSAMVVDDENFGIGGTFVTGGKSDKLLMRLTQRLEVEKLKRESFARRQQWIDVGNITSREQTSFEAADMPAQGTTWLK